MSLDITFSDELKKIIDFAAEVLLEEHPSPYVTTPYFIVSMIDTQDNEAFVILNKIASSISVSNIKDYFLSVIQEHEMLSSRPNKAYKFHDDFLSILIDADKIKTEMIGKDKPLTSSFVFFTILKNDKSIESVFTSSLGLDHKEFLKRMPNVGTQIEPTAQASTITVSSQDPNVINALKNTILASQQSGQIMFPEAIAKPQKRGNILDTFCVDLNEEAEKGNIDKLIGRETELKQIYRVLGRRGKNNIILIGDGGVGKTAIIKGLADRIVKGQVPLSLVNKKIYMLDITALVAGTSMRGMLEERLKNIIKELKKDKNNILFIDDIHTLMSQGKSDVDMSATVNQALSNNEIQVIGTTTYKNYRNAIESNSSFDRKFQKLDVKPSTVEESIEIINGIKDYYEEFHKVSYSDEVISGCVDLSNRYITDRLLPDSAIDVVDEVGSSIRLRTNEPEKIRDLEALLKAFEAEKEDAIMDDDMQRLKDINADIKEYTIQLIDAKNEFEREQKNAKASLEDVYGIISEKSGIPVNKLSTGDKMNLAGINEKMKAVVVGQDEAIDVICQAVKRNRIGLGNPDKPVSFLEIGKTGVGKSLIAKTLAKEVFGDEKYLVRFDMSEYSDKTAVNKLIGTGAGYIGYDNGGLLTEAIKNNKYCVLLCDEIEKADPEIYNVFLQIMDDGRVTDNTGKRIDCKNLILIFTSNIGAREAEDAGKSFGFNPQDENEKTKAVWKRELKSKFSPEFLNRIDNVIYFNSLTDENLKDIIRLELNKVVKRVENIGHTLEYTDKAVEYIFNRIADEHEFGARPVTRVIQDDIINPITDILLENDYKNHNFIVDSSLEDEELELVIS